LRLRRPLRDIHLRSNTGGKILEPVAITRTAAPRRPRAPPRSGRRRRKATCTG